MNLPLTTVAFFYALGVIVGNYFSTELPWLFAGTFIALLAAVFVTKGRRYTLPVLVLVAGWTNYAVQTSIISPHDLRILVGEETKDVNVRGTVSALDVRRFEADGEQKFRSMARIKVEELQIEDEWRPAYGTVLVSTYDSLEGLYFAGHMVEISGVIHPPKRPIASGLFDYRTFLRRQNIHYQLDARSRDDWTSIHAPPSTPISDRFLAWAKKTLLLGLGEEDEALRLIWAMTLGWRSGMTEEVSDDFVRSGTMHIFAISGLHIALISGILIHLLRAVRLPRAWCGAVVVPLLWFYTAATGWQPSAVRSTIMMTVIIGGWALKRPANLLNSLGSAAFIILLWEPQQLFQASFQLSFFVVLSIALLVPRFESLRDRLTQHDPFLPLELIPRWKRILGAPVRWLSIMFVTSLAAWIGSLPLVAYYFQLVTPITLFANIIIVPLADFALMCNLGSLICGQWLCPVTELFNHSGWFFMRSMVVGTKYFAEAPTAYAYIPSPSLLHCTLYYVFVCSVFSGWIVCAKRRKWVFVVIAAILIACLCEWISNYNTWKITILPAEGGETIFVDAPGKKNNLLIDCGNDRSVQYVTKPFLRSQGVNTLPAFLLTHGDVKNMGGATNLITEFKVDRVLASPLKFRSSPYRDAIEWLDQHAELKNQIARGDQLGRWTVLHPASDDKFSQADDGVVVLRGEIHKTRVLFLSDLGRASQHLLWDRASEQLAADIVVAGLPRESEPLNDSMLDAISPRLIIITDAELPASERATIDLKERLSKRGTPVLYCRDVGAVTLKISKHNFTVTTADSPATQ
jgi:competence protein ComEC